MALLGLIRRAASAAAGGRPKELESIGRAVSSRRRYGDARSDPRALAEMIVHGGSERLGILGGHEAARVAALRSQVAAVKLEEWRSMADAAVNHGGKIIFRSIREMPDVGAGEVLLEGGLPRLGDQALRAISDERRGRWAKRKGAAEFGGLLQSAEPLPAIA